MFFFQAEDGIRDLVRSRGLGDVYKRQLVDRSVSVVDVAFDPFTGILYGNDIRNQRLVTINTESGTVSYTHLTLPTSDLV